MLNTIIMNLDWNAIVCGLIFLVGYGVVRLVTNWISFRTSYSKKSMKKMLDIAFDDEIMDEVAKKTTDAMIRNDPELEEIMK